MNSKCSPLDGGRVEVSVFHVKVPRADSLGPQSEQGSEYQYFCEGGQQEVFMELWSFAFDTFVWRVIWIIPPQHQNLHVKHSVRKQIHNPLKDILNSVFTPSPDPPVK